MKTKFLLLLCTFFSVLPLVAQHKVPAMIVYGSDGSRQVVYLEHTNVTDLLVLQNGQSLSVDIPETGVNDIRCITFAMVDTESSMSVESTQVPLVNRVEKMLRDGHVILRLFMQNGVVIDYDIQGFHVVTSTTASADALSN